MQVRENFKDEDIENWTCSFEELEDMFLKIKLNKK